MSGDWRQLRHQRPVGKFTLKIAQITNERGYRSRQRDRDALGLPCAGQATPSMDYFALSRYLTETYTYMRIDWPRGRR